jgi:hypothetical protein
MWLIVEENYSAFICHENFKCYINRNCLMQKSNENIRILENSVLECSLFFVHIIVRCTALFERKNPVYKREVMKVRFFWDVSPFSLVNGYQCFRGSCHFLLHYRRRKELSLL